MPYVFRTQPFRHQRESFEATRDLVSWGLFWEQGCGKTKPMIDTAADLFLAGKIGGVLILAPNGVHRNWINDEIPTHMPEDVLKEATLLHYSTSRVHSTKYLAHCRWVLREAPGLIIVAMSYDGLMTKKGEAFAREFLKSRPIFLIADESHYIKSPNAQRTKRAIAFAKYGKYRRILTGTPMEKPFDVYSQIKFLEPNFWHPLGLGSAAAFRRYFGVWKTAEEVMAEEGYNPGYDQLLGYRNLDELRVYVSKLTHRVTKEDAGLDLPPKLYSKLYFEMSNKQKAAYQQLRDEYFLALQNGQIVEADLAIVRLLRLQQITCGYVQATGEEPMAMVDDKNPRLEMLLAFLDGLPHKAIVWCRFRHDIDQITERLGQKAVRYDGLVTADNAEKAKNDFQKGDVQFLIGNARKGGTGITLHAAKTVVYYSNYFDLILRQQSEDRAHRIGMDKNPVGYVDIIADHTVDGHIVAALREKCDIASEVTGDKLKEWL